MSWHVSLGFEPAPVSCTVAPDWDLWRTFHRLSYSTAAWIPTCCSLASIRSTSWRCCRWLFFLRRQSSFFWRMPRKDLRADLSLNHWDLGPRVQLRPSICWKYPRNPRKSLIIYVIWTQVYFLNGNVVTSLALLTLHLLFSSFKTKFPCHWIMWKTLCLLTKNRQI